jgi:hypothetical protein
MSLFATLNPAGEAVELSPGAPFTTWFVVVASEAEARALGVPIGQRAAYQIGHAWTALDTYGEAELARYCIDKLELPDAPEGQTASPNFGVVDGEISLDVAFEPAPLAPVPAVVSAMQAQLALNAAGRLETVEAAIAGASREVQIYWAKAPSFHRSHPVLLAMAEAVGMGSTDIDDLFRAAVLIA